MSIGIRPVSQKKSFVCKRYCYNERKTIKEKIMLRKKDEEKGGRRNGRIIKEKNSGSR